MLQHNELKTLDFDSSIIETLKDVLSLQQGCTY
jgi:hypothetical protein